MAETYSLVAKLTADIKDFTSKFKQAEDVTSGLKGHTEKMASVNPFTGFLGAGLAVNAISGVSSKVMEGSKMLFDYAGSVEQMKIGWAAIAKQDAAGIMDNINKVAAKTPYEIADIDSAYKSLYNSGIKTADLEKVFTILGDTASGVGAPVEQVTRAFSQMQSKGKVTGEEMLQLSEAGIPAWKLLADAMGLSVAQVQDLSQKGKLGSKELDLLLGSMEKSFGGGMQKQAQSFNGLMSTLSDTVKQVTTPAFEALQSKMKPMLQWAIDTLPQLSTIASNINFNGISEEFSTQIANIQSAIDVIDFSQIGTNFTMIFTNMKPAIAPIVDLMATLGAISFVGVVSSAELISSVLGDVSGLMAAMISQFGSGFWSGLGFDDVGPIVGTVKAAFDNLAEAFFLVASNSDVIAFFQAVGDALGTIGGSILINVINSFKSLSETLVDIAVSDAVTNTFDSMIDIFDTLKGSTGTVTQIFENLTETLNGIAKNTAVQSTISSIASVLSTVGSVAIDGAVKGFGALTEILKNVADTTVVKITFEAIAKAAELLKNAVEFLKPIFETVINAIVAVASNKAVVEIFNAIAIAVGICVAPIAALVAIFLAVCAAFEIASAVVAAFTVVMGIFNAVMAMNPFVLIMIGIVALIAAIVLIATHFETVKNAVMAFVAPIGNFFTQLGTQIGSVFSSIGKAIGDTFNAIITFLTPVFETIGAIIQTYINIWLSIFNVFFTVIQTVWNSLVTVVQTVFNIIMTIAQTFFTMFSPLFTLAFDIIKTAFIVAFTLISAFAQIIFAGMVAIWNVLVAVFSAIFDAVSSVVGACFNTMFSIASAIFGAVQNVWNALVGVFSGILGGVQGVFQSVFAAISGVVSNVFNTVGNVWNGAIGVFTGIFGSVQSAVSSAFSNIQSTISGVFDAVKGAWSGLSTFASGVTNGIGEAFKRVAQAVKDVINAPIGALNGALGIINKIPGVNVPSIPYLYRGTDDWQGGFARMNEGGRGELVNLPNGTQVIPHDISRVYAKESARASQQNGSQQEITVNVSVENSGDVFLDGERVGNVAWRSVRKNVERDSFNTGGALRGFE